jgi:hypothetical protein
MAVFDWVLWAHITSVFGFLIAHGGSSLAIFTVKKTKEPERLRALLDMSRLSYVISYVFVLLVLATGITLGFLGGFWGQLWIWIAILVAFAMIAVMFRFGTAHFNSLRKAVGLSYNEGMKQMPPLPDIDPTELDKLLSSTRPVELSVVGVVGLLVIAWLMVFRPF